MAEPGLSISYNELLQAVATFLGYSPDVLDLSCAQLDEVDRVVQSGVRQFYYPPAAAEGVEAGYQWTFLSPTASITTVADEGVQDLPDDFGRLLGVFHYDAAAYHSPIVQTSEARIQAMLSRDADAGAPVFACVRHRTQESGDGHRFEVAWWPVPNDAYTLEYRYEAFSGKLSAANPYPLGGMRYAELLTESCLAIAEQRANDERGQHTEAFLSLLRAGIAMDRRQGARFFGQMGGEEHALPTRRMRSGDVTYKGSTW